MFVVVAGVLVMASAASACVIFKGDFKVQGATQTGNTVTGSGGGHSYCPGYGPTTAAAGPMGSKVDVEVEPASACNPYTYTNPATGAKVDLPNQLPDGPYEVRLNTAKAYTGEDGSAWTMVGGSGCFRAANAATTTLLGFMQVESGRGSAELVVAGKDPTFVNQPGEASNICVGQQDNAVTGAPVPPPLPGEFKAGMLAPFRVVVL